MPTNTVEKPQEIYQIKVTLLGTDPPIWRRLLIPADLTFVLAVSIPCDIDAKRFAEDVLPESTYDNVPPF